MVRMHQLAAIMFLDIEGYTAIMQDDEARALLLRNKLKKKLEEEVVVHQGVLLEFRGDGALCSFGSAIEGVRAAITLQREMQTDPRVPLRIGIHTGDVIIDGHSALGDSVNIASRMESLAEPGSIFITGKVFDDIKNQKDILTVPLGKFQLKNVVDQIDIYAIGNPGIVIPESHRLAGKGERIQHDCILVLPFVNLSDDTGQEYFSDGLTEELISTLSRLKGMKVISRTTSMKYKGISKDIKTIGKETGANFIVEGSVRKHGNNLRITSQFIDSTRDIHLWAESYRGTMDDVFLIQEQVSAKIVEALRMKISGEVKTHLQKRYTANTEAWQCYLQGRYMWNKRNEAGLRSAIKYFEKALEKDPDYALAWVGLADTYSLMGEFTTMSRMELLPKLRAAIHKALQLDNHLGEAHISLAISVMLNEWDWKRAEKEFKLGLELSPNYATGHHWYAEWLLFTGDTEKAMEEISIAIELDPVSPGILKDKGIFYYYTRQYDQAIGMARSTLELDPEFANAHRLLSLAYNATGMLHAAIAENTLWGQKTGNPVKTDIALAQIYASAGYQDDARKILIPYSDEKTLTSNDLRGMALVYAALKENDVAFEWLEKSYAQQEESLCSLKLDPKLDNLRSDPRFAILVRKIGLEP